MIRGDVQDQRRRARQPRRPARLAIRAHHGCGVHPSVVACGCGLLAQRHGAISRLTARVGRSGFGRS
jgi:hypothetical protein